MQVYNLGIDEATKSNQATVTYQISKTVAATATTAASDTVVLKNNWIQRIWALIATR